MMPRSSSQAHTTARILARSEGGRSGPGRHHLIVITTVLGHFLLLWLGIAVIVAQLAAKTYIIIY
jgi:hypothetical protein